MGFEPSQHEVREGLLDSMTLDAYLSQVEPAFERRSIDPPSRLSPSCFKSDEEPSELLLQAREAILSYWPEAADRGEKVNGIYLVGPHASGTFHKDSDIDIAVHFEGDHQRRGMLSDPIREHLTREGIPACGRHVEYDLKGGRIDIGLFAIKPFGPLFDLINKEWMTFGKTVGDYLSFQWQVYGIE